MSLYEKIPATAEDVERYAGEISAAYLHCRTWHHAPEPHDIRMTKGDDKHPSAVWEAHLRCQNGCGVRWRVLVDAEGQVLMRRLDYSAAPDYVLKGKGRINKEGNQILRREYFLQKGPKATKRGKR